MKTDNTGEPGAAAESGDKPGGLVSAESIPRRQPMGVVAAAMRSHWKNVGVPLMVFLVGLTLSLLAARSAKQETERAARSRFDAAAVRSTNEIERRFTGYVEVLYGLRALFATGEVGREDFRRYAQNLELKQKFPGFQVLNYAPYVPGPQRAEFEAAVRADPDLAPDLRQKFAITPPGVRSVHYPLTYIEPLQGNEFLLGKDMAAVPGVLPVLEGTRDSGELTSSGKAVQVKGPDAHVGLALRLPIYRVGMPTATVEQRRAAYAGSVGAGVRISTMFGGLDSELDGLRLRLYDGGRVDGASKQGKWQLPHDKLLFDSRDPDGGARPVEQLEAENKSADDAAMSRVEAFSLGGRQWLVEASIPAGQGVSTFDRAVPLIVLAGGAIISALLGGVLFSLLTSHRRAVSIAHVMTHSLRAGERRLAEAQSLAKVGSWVLDVDTGVLECSPEARRIYGFTLTERLPRLGQLMALIPEAQRDGVRALIESAERGDAKVETEHQLTMPDGTERWVHINLQRVTEGGKTTVQGTVRDETARKKAALRLEVAHAIARQLAGDIEIGSAIRFVLRSSAELLGWDAAVCWSVNAQGQVNCTANWSVSTSAKAVGFATSVREWSGDAAGTNLVAAWNSGNILWRAVPVHQAVHVPDDLARQAGFHTALTVPVIAGQPLAALEFFSSEPVAVDRDILGFMQSIASQLGQYLQRKQAEQALRHLASHDTLTGLANRPLLHERLAQAIKRAERHEKRLAVLFLDLDRFKFINDSLGHSAGDALLQTCAQRLKECVRETDTVARFGGDEFVIVLEDLHEGADAVTPVMKLLARCGESFVVNGRELPATASIGISVYPEDGQDVETLLMNADTAMYRAKEKGRSTYHFYSAQMNAHGQEQLELQSHLRRALERNELFLVYQPKLDLRTRQVTGVEALMRWRHPALGLVSPAQFIPLAEDIGLIEQFGRWALEVACRDACRWRDEGHPVQVSVNLSARQLNRPQLAVEVAEVLTNAKLDPALLELEITESGVMHNPNRAASLLQELRGLGVSLAIDDFGTGYSSLSYLQRFPLSTLKIDRSFIKDLPGDDDASSLTAGIIGLAHRLRMKVVAEGVETVEQLAYLRSNACDEIQGYYLSKPIAAEEISRFLAVDLRNLMGPTVAA